MRTFANVALAIASIGTIAGAIFHQEIARFLTQALGPLGLMICGTGFILVGLCWPFYFLSASRPLDRSTYSFVGLAVIFPLIFGVLDLTMYFRLTN